MIVGVERVKSLYASFQHRSSMTRPNLLRRVLWSWALPLLATAITASLIVAAVRDNAAFWAAHPGLTDTPGEFQSPFSLLAQILNGPGFFFPWPFGAIDVDWIRLPGVALFWAWLGRGLDRRLRGEQTKIKSSRSGRVAGNLVMVGIAGLFAFEFLRLLHMQTLLPFDNAFRGLMWNTPWHVKLRLTASGWYVGLAWSVVYVFYLRSELSSRLYDNAAGEQRSPWLTGLPPTLIWALDKPDSREQTSWAWR